MDENALIREIGENPELDKPVMIYADWLEDRGDQRAEFLRTQSEFNKFDFDHPAVVELRSSLSDHWNSLAQGHRTGWTWSPCDTTFGIFRVIWGRSNWSN